MSPSPSGLHPHHPWLFGLLLTWLTAAAHAATPPPLDTLWRGVQTQEVGGTSLHLEAPESHHDRVSTTLRRPDGREAARVDLRHPSHPGHPIGGLSVELHLPRGDLRDAEEREAVRALRPLLHHLASGEAARLAEALPVLRDDQNRWSSRARAHLSAARWPALAAAIWLVAIGARRRRLTWSWGLKPNHVVPSLLQLAIFAYWSRYFPGVADRIPDILSQLVFAFALDALLNWTRHGHWRIGVGPLPIVLSTNLFVWFAQPAIQWFVIGVAIASRLLLQRHGRHLFNPSAFGVATAALLALLLPGWLPWGSPTMDEEFNLAPNMTEFLMLVALVAQSRFPIVLVPISAVTAFSYLS